MARIIAAITRALALDSYREPSVHFHARSADEPQVCYDEACRQPRLEVR